MSIPAINRNMKEYGTMEAYQSGTLHVFLREQMARNSLHSKSKQKLQRVKDTSLTTQKVKSLPQIDCCNFLIPVVSFRYCHALKMKKCVRQTCLLSSPPKPTRCAFKESLRNGPPPTPFFTILCLRVMSNSGNTSSRYTSSTNHCSPHQFRLISR